MKRLLLFSLLIFAFFSSKSQDFSNKGKDFWVGYGYHQIMTAGNGQQMVLYFATEAVTNITVSIPGLAYTQTYSNIPANTIYTTLVIPSSGFYDARLLTEALYDKGIHIASDKPIVAYAHIYNASVSGATLLFPTNTLGKEYFSVNYKNTSNTDNANCWFYVVAADTGTTIVEITPSAATLTHAANVPFTVSLTQGQIYNVMGQLTTFSNPYRGVDLTGSKIKSLSSGTSGCKRIAVYSGSGRISITCNNSSSSSDNYMTQCLPKTAWGQKYLTVPTSVLPYNFFRICVIDPTTVVKLNGAILNQATLNNNFYYEIGPTNTPDLIEADKPIMVAQYITSQGACGNGSPGDPEVIYLSPVEQNINKVILNSTPFYAITQHYINVVIPNSGTAISSFRIDGNTPSNPFVVHPQNSAYAYLQQQISQGQHIVQSDSGFNAIAYGFGSAESYGYNAGTNVKDLYQFIGIINQYGIVAQPSACSGSPFYFSITLPYQPLSLYWDFHGFQTPNVTQTNPLPDTTYFVNGKQVWRYKIPTSYQYSVGTYPVTVTTNNPTPEGCTGEQVIDFDLNVYNPPVADFYTIHNGCISDSVQFRDTSNSNGRLIYRWYWNFGDGTFGNTKNPKHLYALPGTYNVRYHIITDVGCLSDTITKQITITAVPIAKFGISAPDCDGKPITFIDSSQVFVPGTLTKWYWDFGDGNTLIATTNANQVHTYSPYGNKTATLKVETSSGCQSILFSKSFYINPNPKPDFTMPPGICLPADSAHFFDASTIADNIQAGFTFLWNFGDLPSGAANTSTIKNPAHYYNNAGPFSINLKVTSAAGCFHDTTKVLSTVYPQAHADFTVNAENCLNDTTTFTDQSNGQGSNVTTWFWNFGDGSAIGNAQNATHVYTTANTYIVKHWIKTDKGCTSDTMSKQVIINPLPAAKFGVSLPNCVSTNITFSDSSVANAGNITLWKWNLGDGTILNLNNNNPFTHLYAASGNYSITLSVETNKGCKSTLYTKQITVNPRPAPDFTMSTVCLPGGVAQFTDLSTISDGTQGSFTYLWNFGEPGSGPLNTSTLRNPQHRYSSVGPFNVTLTVTSGNGCIKDTIKQLTQVYPQPTANFTVAPENCLNDTTTFTDQSNGQGSIITEWHWSFGDGQTSALQNPAHVYGTSNTYTVKLYTKTDKGCISDTISKQVIINPLPTAAFTNSSPACAGKTVTFTSTSAANAGNIILWKWDLGDGTLLNLNNNNPVTHTYATTGTYTVTLSVETDKGCKSTLASRPIVVNAQPVANFNLPQVCLNDAYAQFLDSSYIGNGTDSSFTYQWNFGDPSSGALNTSAQKNPRHKYNAAGIYNVTLSVTSVNGCMATIVKPFTVNGAIPKANFTVLNSNSLCSNTNVQIKDSSTVDFGSLTKIEIYWNYANTPTVFDVDNTPTINEIYSHLYANFQSPLTKVFSVHVRAYSGIACMNEKIINVTINATPNVQFNTIPDACFTAAPYQITQASETGGVPGTGVFTGPGINASGIFNPTAAGMGSHTLRYTFTSNKGCVDFKEQTINVVAPPVARFGYSSPDCETKAVTFSDSSNTPAGTITTWTWDFGDGTPIVVRNTSAPFTHTFATANTYTVKLTVTTNNGCNSSPYTASVKINPQPVVDFSFSKACLPNANALFSDLSTIADGTGSQFTYVWNFGDLSSGASNTSTQKNPSHAYTATGPYTVSLTVTSGNGCIASIQKQYNDIHPQPQAKFSANTSEVCAGSAVTFTDISTGGDTTLKAWQWNFADGITSLQQNPPPHVFNTGGNYNVQLTVTNNNDCVSTSFTLPIIINAYPVVDAGPDRNVLEGGTITLEPIVTGNNLSYLWSPANYLSSTIIKNPVVTGVADQLYTLTVTSGIGCSKSDQVFVKVLIFPKIPNTFTPNNDGINDTWVIQYLETYPGNRVQVFNRYGQLVFESRGYAKPWDGTMNGKSLPFGTYYYIIEPGSGRKPLTGYVTLIK